MRVLFVATAVAVERVQHHQHHDRNDGQRCAGDVEWPHADRVETEPAQTNAHHQQQAKHKARVRILLLALRARTNASQSQLQNMSAMDARTT